jgi:hypothetical protein
MFKIWLNWLQPSLGVLGTALVLSNPLCSIASPILAAANQTNKSPAQPPKWSSAKSGGTNIDQELLKGIATTPDQAVRQLAINTMVTSGEKPLVAAATTAQNFSPLANFIGTPARFQQLSAKVKKPQQINQSIIAALTPITKPQAKVLVPGLAIGTANVRVSAGVLPTVKPATQKVAAATRVGATVQLAAIVPEKTVPSPFPVVHPELMQKLQADPVFASAQDIKTATLDLKSIGAISTGLPKTVDTASLNPIAAIPAGLQQLLGNNFDSGTKVSVTPVSKATGPNFRSMAALTKLVSPSEIIAPASVTKTSLQLATAQAYAAVPKFSIPGEAIVSANPAANVMMGKRNVTTASVAGKSNSYVSLIGNRRLTPAIRQSWTAIGQNSNLGGLILGSQQLATLPKVISLLPMTTIKNPNFTGVTLSDLGNIN